MADLNSFESHVFRQLGEKIALVIRANADDLARGNAKAGGSDASATAMNYCENVGYIRALYNVLDWCEEIENKITGRNT